MSLHYSLADDRRSAPGHRNLDDVIAVGGNIDVHPIVPRVGRPWRLTSAGGHLIVPLPIASIFATGDIGHAVCPSNNTIRRPAQPFIAYSTNPGR